MSKTEFYDKSGKPLYTGDLVQYRLSLNGKGQAGGPTLLYIDKAKKGIVLRDPRAEHGIGWPMRQKYEQYISLVDTQYREE